MFSNLFKAYLSSDNDFDSFDMICCKLEIVVL